MYYAIGPVSAVIPASLGAGCAIKLLDDALDQPTDRAAGVFNWADALGRGTVAYALLCLGVASAFLAPWSLALLGAAYCWGMAGHLGERLPTRLRAWQESALVAAALGVWLRWEALAGLAVVLTVQTLDDAWDERTNSTGWADRRWPGLALGALGLAVSVLLAPWALAAAVALWLVATVLAESRGDRKQDEPRARLHHTPPRGASLTQEVPR